MKNHHSTSSWQFSFFRILFGTYLTIHFATLIPWAAELFSHDGIIPDARLNLTAGLFPNPLAWPLPPAAVVGFVCALTALSICLALGFARPVVSLLLWFGWSALFHRNNLIGNPSIPYIGLLLMLCAITPRGEALACGEKNPDWEMPVWIPRCAWILLAAGYTFSGWTKLSSPSWIDGSAMQHVLENPLARPGFVRTMMLALPAGFLKAFTWGTIAAESLYLPLACYRKTRPWIWLLLVVMHLGIITVIDFADLSFGMLMVHAFTFDRRWIAGKFSKLIVAYDAECLMCSRWVHFVASLDERHIVRFTPLQNSYGKALAERCAAPSLTSSIIVEADGKVLTKYHAVRAILESFGGLWRVIAWGAAFFPKKFADRIYDIIAANRHRWFRGKTSCSLVAAEFISLDE